jgi:Resolvase, N terminal domain
MGGRAAWLALAAIAHNLTRATGCLASPWHARATGATIRRQLINVPARLAHSARRLRLHLPLAWPWAADWLQLFAALLARYRVPVHFTDAPPLDDPQARLLVQIQGVIAEHERAKFAERGRRGKLYRSRAGEVLSTKVPYGYRRVSRTADRPHT